MNPWLCIACLGQGQLLVETFTEYAIGAVLVVDASRGTCKRCDGTGVDPERYGLSQFKRRRVSFGADTRMVTLNKTLTPSPDSEL